MKRGDFGADFRWGAATSAFQIEGATREDGRGPSIWDDFGRARRRGWLGLGGKSGQASADVACDHYHRYREDVELLAALHVDAYRFSIAWPRLLPEGTGRVNRDGVDFYHRLLDSLAARGITPFVTLYHWDLPLALERRGGWTNREVAQWFAEFAGLCAREYGDKVRHWILLNEGLTFTGLGHFFGTHAPRRRRLRNFLPALHHCLLAQAEAGRRIKERRPEALVGTAVAFAATHPLADRERDRAAVRRVDALGRAFVDPLVGRGYPVEELPLLGQIERRVARPGDQQRIRFPLDFLGINHYFRLTVRHSSFVPYLRAAPVTRADAERTANGWEVHPPGIGEVLRGFGRYAEIPGLYVTENGAAYDDVLGADARVEDRDRASYLQRYLAEVLAARRAGVAVRGYFVWSLLDNYEWDRGYEPRFGLVHVDRATQRRTLKASGCWYRDFLAQP